MRTGGCVHAPELCVEQLLQVDLVAPNVRRHLHRVERAGFRVEQRAQTPHTATHTYNTTHSATDNAQSTHARVRIDRRSAIGRRSAEADGCGGSWCRCALFGPQPLRRHRWLGMWQARRAPYNTDVGSRARHAAASRAAGPRQTSAGSPSRRSPWPYSLAPAAPRSAGAKAQSSFGSTASRNVPTAVVFNASLGDAASTHSRWLEEAPAAASSARLSWPRARPRSATHRALTTHRYSRQRPARV